MSEFISIQNVDYDDEPPAVVAASVSTDNEETSVRNTNSGLYSESEAEKIRVYVAGVADNDPSVATTYATERTNNPNLPTAKNAKRVYESRNGILVSKSSRARIVTAEAADDTADNLVKAYRSTLNNYNSMGSKRGLREYAAKHRHIHGGFGHLLDLKWQNRPQYTSEDFAAVKLEPAVAAFIANDDAAAVIGVGSFVTYNGEGRYRVTGTRGDTGTQWMLEGGRTWGLEKFMRLHPDQDSAL